MMTPINPTYDTSARADAHELNLTHSDLARICNALGHVYEANVRFEGDMIVGRHRVSVRWEDDQREGVWPVVTSIRST